MLEFVCGILFFTLDLGRMEAIKKILRLENMLGICLFFQTSELKYAYKLYAYKKRV